MDKKELPKAIILGILIGMSGILLLVGIESAFRSELTKSQQSIEMMISDVCGNEIYNLKNP